MVLDDKGWHVAIDTKHTNKNIYILIIFIILSNIIFFFIKHIYRVIQTLDFLILIALTLIISNTSCSGEFERNKNKIKLDGDKAKHKNGGCKFCPTCTDCHFDPLIEVENE